jgi:hypothetical protein
MRTFNTTRFPPDGEREGTRDLPLRLQLSGYLCCKARQTTSCLLNSHWGAKARAKAQRGSGWRQLEGE